MRTLRGRGHAFPFPEDGAATLSSEQGHSMNGTGFRVVHDDANFQETRGRCWQHPVPRPEWQLDHPDDTGDNLGFRLAWERS